jgi:hypothetical protein
VRFYGRTQSSSTTLHFRTWATSLVSYFKTGGGSAIPTQLTTQSVTLDDHSATLLSCVNTSSADQGNYASTATPFACGTAANEWNIGDDGYWSAATLDQTTLHQMWVRPSTLYNASRTATSSSLVSSSSRLAVMTHPDLDASTTFSGNSGDSYRTMWLPFAFNFFSVNYGADSTTGGLSLGDNGYITLGYNSTVASITSASSPGAGLFLGAADRALLYYGLTPSQTEGGLTYATAVIRYYSSATGANEDQVNLEVTFAKNSVNQFIEIRAGTISYGAAGTAGTWGLSDGFQFLVNSTAMPALASGQSMVLQSDLEGRYWVPHVNSSLAIRAPPTPPDNGAAFAVRFVVPPQSAAAAEAEAVPRFLSSGPLRTPT